MEGRRNIAGGVVLIVLGVLFLLGRSFPGLFSDYSWPLIIVGVGAFFLLAAGLFRVGPLAVPGFVVGGIGGILYYQYLSGDWESWSYLWAMIPGFVGLGVITASLISSEMRAGLRPGLILLVISGILLVIFGGAFGAIWSLQWVLPLVLIVAGVFILIKAFLRK